MKAVMISIKPKYVAKILNSEKTIEVRKVFPKEYKGWVYIYCTKDKENELLKGYKVYDREEIKYIAQGGTLTLSDFLNGKVVARFYCDKVEEIKLPYTKFGTDEWVGCESARTLQTKTLDEKELLKKSCIGVEEIYKYLNFKNSPNNVGYAWHIDNLEIFDEPKELSEFKGLQRAKATDCGYLKQCKKCGKIFNRCHLLKPLTKTPKTMCYVEVKE